MVENLPEGLAEYRNLKAALPYKHEVMLLLRMLVPLGVLAVLIYMTVNDVKNERLHNALKLCMSMCVLSLTACAVVVHWHHPAKCPHQEPSWLTFDGVYHVDSDFFAALGLAIWVVIGFVQLCTDFVGFCKNIWAFVSMSVARIYVLLTGMALIDAEIETMIQGHAPFVVCSAAFCLLLQWPRLMCMLDSFSKIALIAYNIVYTLAYVTPVIAIICIFCVACLYWAAAHGYAIDWQQVHKFRNVSLFWLHVTGSMTLPTGASTTEIKATEANIDAITKEIATKKSDARDFWQDKPKRQKRPEAVEKHFNTHCLVQGISPTEADIDKVLEEFNFMKEKDARKFYRLKELGRLGLMKLKGKG